MVLRNILVIATLCLGLLGFAASGHSTKVDFGPRPIIVLPSDDTLNRGDTFTVTVTMDRTVGSNTAVAISSSSSLVSVPSSVTVPSGSNYVTFGASVAPDYSARAKSTVVRITASTVDGSAYSDVTIN